MDRSRLAKRYQRQTLKTLILSVLGIIAILFLLVKFGVPLLANISLFLSNTKNKQEVTKKKDVFVAPPVLDALPNATNSAQINVSGTATPGEKINLYINGELEEKTDVQKDHTFVFEKITLKDGENHIQTKSITKDKNESDFSNQYTIVFKKEPPALTIESPSNDQKFSKDDKRTEVKGKTDPNVKVTVNDFWAIVDSDGNFSYTLPLKDGDNTIKVTATDEAGNKTEKEVKVNYSQ